MSFYATSHATCFPTLKFTLNHQLSNFMGGSFMKQQHFWNIAIVDQQSGPIKLWRRALTRRHRLSFFDSCDALLEQTSLHPDEVNDDTPHLIVVDWDGQDGQAAQLLHTLRHEYENGLATMAVVDEDDPELGLEACESGVNEFITRPIDQYELATRVRHLLEFRPRNLSLPEHYHPFRFDLNRRTVAVNGQLHRPRPKEFDLLLYLFRRPDRVIPRSSLRDHVWFGESEECRSIDTYISHLRSLFGLNGDSGWIIKSVYGKGYRLSRYDEAEFE